MKEIAKAAEVLEIDVSIAEEKYFEICKVNNLDPETEGRFALSLFRQWFSGKYQYKDAPQEESSSSFIKKAAGFFISIDAAQDMGQRLNEQIKGEYERDSHDTYESGRVAEAVATDTGFAVSRMFKSEEQTKEVTDLPTNNFEVDAGKWIIPLDSMEKYGERPNPNYGKPLPASQSRMSGVFIGDVDEDRGMYYFSYKGEASKEFTPKTFTVVKMDVIRDSNNPNRIYGFKEGTLNSLEIEDEDTTDQLNLQNATMEYAMSNYSPLIDINRYHNTVSDKLWAERFVITDGSVSSINMTPNKLGSRRLTITDVNADYAYEGGSWAGTTCWVPPHLDIDFGLNSSVILVGRTTQGRNEDGSLRDVALNLSGVLCTENRGVIVEPFEAEEEDLDWF